MAGGGADETRRRPNLLLRPPLAGAVVVSTIQDPSPRTTFLDRAAGRKWRPPPLAGQRSSPHPTPPLPSPRRSAVAASTSRSSSDAGKVYTARASSVRPKPLLSLLAVRLPAPLVCIARTWRRTREEFSNSYMSPDRSKTTLLPLQCTRGN